MANELEFERELDVACTVVQLCASLTQRLQKESVTSQSAAQKKDFSPVTIGDYAMQALLTCALRGTFELDNFIAEETADKLRHDDHLRLQVWQLVDSARSIFDSSSLQVPSSMDEMIRLIDLGGKNQISHEQRTWVLDPIDGTSTFLKGQQYAINCALLVDGVEQIGIIGCPNLPFEFQALHEDLSDDRGGLMLFAIRGRGAWKRAMRYDAKLTVPEKVGRDLKSSVETLIWSDCSTRTSIIRAFHRLIADKLGSPWPGVDLYSSLMNYTALGLGCADLMIRVFKQRGWHSNIWDHAGGVLIFEEAGGKVTDLEGNTIDFSRGRKMSGNHGLVCAPKNLHPKVLEIIQQALRENDPY